jgi:hypothetical protein
MVEKKGDRPVDRGRVDEMIVIQDKGGRGRLVGEAVDKPREDRFPGRGIQRMPPRSDVRSGGPEAGQRLFPGSGLDSLGGCNQVREKASQVVEALVKRKPSDFGPTLLCPSAQQRRFAIAGGGRDQDQLSMETVIQETEQPRSMDQAHPHRRDGVAHFEERVGHLGKTSVPEDQAETPLFILSNWRLEGNPGRGEKSHRTPPRWGDCRAESGA